MMQKIGPKELQARAQREEQAKKVPLTELRAKIDKVPVRKSAKAKRKAIK